MTTDSLHHAGKNGSISMENTCIMLVRMGSIPVWRISMKIIATHTTSTSLVVPSRAYKRLNIFAILSIALDLNIKPPRYEYITKRHVKSNQPMDSPNAFSNYVKTTLNHELSLSEVDLADCKRETTKHGPSLMEVNQGGKIEPNNTSSGCMLMQVDRGGNSEPTI